jgi:phenylacetate-coenzyme A ligase PaaK-like adenylate-forming protein
MPMLIDKNKVTSVYSGKVKRCCCGCSGKHYYASRVIGRWEELRGYPFKADDINDAMITRIVNKINNFTGKVEVFKDNKNIDYFYSIEVGKRWYIAYLEKVT